MYLSVHFFLFGHIARMDLGVDVKKLLTAFPPEAWKRLHGRSQIKWMKMVLDDLKLHNLTLTEVVNVAWNQPMWRLLAMIGAVNCS